MHYDMSMQCIQVPPLTKVLELEQFKRDQHTQKNNIQFLPNQKYYYKTLLLTR